MMALALSALDTATEGVEGRHRVESDFMLVAKLAL